MKKLIAIVAVALIAVVGTAAAKPASHPPSSHRCTPHARAYSISGTLVSGSLTSNGRHRYSGTLTVHVTHGNKHASGDVGSDKTYTLDHANVNLGHGENAAVLTPQSRVKLNGKITELPPGCAQPFTSTTTIRKASIKPPKTHQR